MPGKAVEDGPSASSPATHSGAPGLGVAAEPSGKRIHRGMSSLSVVLFQIYKSAESSAYLYMYHKSNTHHKFARFLKTSFM